MKTDAHCGNISSSSWVLEELLAGALVSGCGR